MNRHRFARHMAVAAGFVLMCALPGLTHAQSASPTPMRGPLAVSQGDSEQKDSSGANDFSGFDYSSDQKTEIDKIHRDTKSRLDVVAKAPNLTPDQKEAMALGYTRLEYGQLYKVLTPEQRRRVQQRIRARRAEQEAAKRPQPPVKPQ